MCGVLAPLGAARRTQMEFSFMRKITSPLIALALLGATALAACNTVEGVGEDVQAAGQAVEQTAQETNDGNPSTP